MSNNAVVDHLITNIPTADEHGTHMLPSVSHVLPPMDSVETIKHSMETVKNVNQIINRSLTRMKLKYFGVTGNKAMLLKEGSS
jgi:hypothetical protein